MVGVVKIGVPGSGTNTPRTPRPPDARGQQPPPPPPPPAPPLAAPRDEAPHSLEQCLKKVPSALASRWLPHPAVSQGPAPPPPPPRPRPAPPAPTSLGRAALATMIAALAPALVDNVIGEEFVRTR